MAIDLEPLATYLGNEYALSLAAMAVSFILFYAIKKLLLTRLKIIAKRTKTDIDDIAVEIINGLGWPFYLFISIYIGLMFIVLPADFATLLNYALVIVFSYYTAKSINEIVDYAANKIISAKRREKDEDTSLIELLGRITKATVWLFAIMVVLQNIGFDITAVAAGIGIGGIAIAFAVQNILTDVFSSFSIYFDKPFRRGDFIVVGNDMGVVKKIGIKSTRLKTLEGEELIISNKELTEARIHNYKKMKERVITFTFGIVGETATKKLMRVNKIVKSIFSEIEDAELIRVHFKSLGDFSLIYEVQYKIKGPDYITYMNIQQKINTELKKRFEKEKIEFAYPTQTVFIRK